MEKNNTREAIEALEAMMKDFAAGSKESEAALTAVEALKKMSCYKQIRWERDVALKTLEEHGIGLGQRTEDISEDDIISRKTSRRKFEELYNWLDDSDMEIVMDTMDEIPPITRKELKEAAMKMEARK